MFDVLFRCCAFLVVDAEKVVDKEVESSTPPSEPSATDTDSKGAGRIQKQHELCDVTTSFLFLRNRFQVRAQDAD